MRLKHAALFVLLFTIGVTGQEEPLPGVTPAVTPEPELMLVALDVEPIRELPTVTLAEAARAHDYVTFDALYRKAKEEGTSVAPFDTLHELWTYSVTDPVGAFYGTEMYERLSRAYPGFAAFIDEHRVVDSNGNVFYPTSETRQFVFARALEGRSAPRVLIAEAEPAEEAAPVVQPKRAAAETAAPDTAAPRVPVRRRRTEETPKAVVAAVEPPVVIRAEVESAPTQSAEGAAPVAQPAPAVEQVAAAVETTTPIGGAAAEPAVAAPVAAPAAAAAVTPAVPAQNSPASRGLLLIVVGIMGAGLLAVMLRTPRETLPTVIVTQAAPEEKQEQKPAAPVEPIRRPEAAREANRASGSRG